MFLQNGGRADAVEQGDHRRHRVRQRCEFPRGRVQMVIFRRENQKIRPADVFDVTGRQSGPHRRLFAAAQEAETLRGYRLQRFPPAPENDLMLGRIGQTGRKPAPDNASDSAQTYDYDLHPSIHSLREITVTAPGLRPVPRSRALALENSDIFCRWYQFNRRFSVITAVSLRS